MQLASRVTIQHLCREYQFRPSRSSGQNFLISADVLRQIVSAADVRDGDTVLEIGAGFGTLTAELARGRAKRVVAVELDTRLFRALSALARRNKNVEATHGDIFKLWPELSCTFPDGTYKLVSNLPYNITSLVVRNFLEFAPRPSEIVVLVQREVAERITSRPGQMSMLSVVSQFYSVPAVIAIIDRYNFWPSPDVDSAIVRFAFIGKDTHGFKRRLGEIPEKFFFTVAKAGFSSKRKQLHNNLTAVLRIESADARRYVEEIGLSPAVRAQELTLENWVEITKKVYSSRIFKN